MIDNAYVEAGLDPLRVLFLSDTYPGHHNFADGVLAAIKLLRPVEPIIVRSRAAPNIRMRMVRPMTRGNRIALQAALVLGYGINPARLPEAELVLSGGGETLAANVAAARLLNAPNIFCGSVRGGIHADQFSLVVDSYDRIDGPPNHISTLKPSIFGSEHFNRPRPYIPFGVDRKPRLAGLLLGGDSGYFRYSPSEWADLRDRIMAISKETGIRWIISTSRRTPTKVADQFSSLAEDKRIVDHLIDFRSAGPGSLFDLFDRSEIVVCTADSSSMLSEAIAVRLPVVALYPKLYGFKPPEAAYRDKIRSLNWARYAAIAELDGSTLLHHLAEIVPRENDHLTELSQSIRDKMPELFGAAQDLDHP